MWIRNFLLFIVLILLLSSCSDVLTGGGFWENINKYFYDGTDANDFTNNWTSASQWKRSTAGCNPGACLNYTATGTNVVTTYNNVINTFLPYYDSPIGNCTISAQIKLTTAMDAGESRAAVVRGNIKSFGAFEEGFLRLESDEEDNGAFELKVGLSRPPVYKLQLFLMDELGLTDIESFFTSSFIFAFVIIIVLIILSQV